MSGAYRLGVLGRRAWWRPGAAGVLALAALVAFQLTPVSAQTSPFTGTGIDVSYPNCSASLPPTNFAIVGVTDGRPFTTYKCLRKLWSKAKNAAGGIPSAYFNTGYSGAYGRDVTQVCKSRVSSGFTPPSGLSRHALKQADQAWEIGCSEASYAYGVLKAMSQVPTMLFADIETGNSWSSNVTLNQYAIDGISWGMANPTKLGYSGSKSGYTGVYSLASAWTAITGSVSWSPTPQVTANWVAGLKGKCPKTSPFDPGTAAEPTPTWLSQTAVGGIDTDKAC